MIKNSDLLVCWRILENHCLCRTSYCCLLCLFSQVWSLIQVMSPLLTPFFFFYPSFLKGNCSSWVRLFFFCVSILAYRMWMNHLVITSVPFDAALGAAYAETRTPATTPVDFYSWDAQTRAAVFVVPHSHSLGFCVAESITWFPSYNPFSHSSIVVLGFTSNDIY